MTSKPPTRYVAQTTDVKCVGCGNKLRRLAREGFLERKIFSFLGYFPWECVMCRKRLFFRDDGHGTAIKKKRIT